MYGDVRMKGRINNEWKIRKQAIIEIVFINKFIYGLGKRQLNRRQSIVIAFKWIKQSTWPDIFITPILFQSFYSNAMLLLQQRLLFLPNPKILTHPIFYALPNSKTIPLFYNNPQKTHPMQQTQIIKLNSLKSSISSLFQNLTTKCNSTKDYDITVIVKQSDTPQSPGRKINTVGFNDNPMILNEELSQSLISLNQNVNSSNSIHSQHAIEDKRHKMANKIRFKKKDEKENANEMKVKTSTEVQTEELPVEDQRLHTEFKIEESPSNSERYSFKLNNVEVDSINSEEDSEAADEDDGGFLIEKCLNQALELIESNRIEELQEFLYKFKEKHSFTNLRTEAKWSLLMGYCKQNKLEFERAATNYAQVINSITKNPLMVTVELADIHCRLGRCYFQIGEWNKAIAAYSCSLNIYKKNKKCLNYANCITNLGVLYLQIGYFIQAQRCFLMAFDIKRCEGDKKDKKARINLLQTYFHLFDCNLSLKNLIQCQQILGNVGTIIQDTQTILQPLLKVRYFIRCGKLLFFQGKLQFCQNYYHHALNLLKRNSFVNVQHAEVMELMAILKQEMEDFQRSKYYYEKAYHYLQKCVASDSPKLQILKKKIDATGEILNRVREGNRFRFNKNTMFTEEGGRGKDIQKRKRNSTEMIMRERVVN